MSDAQLENAPGGAGKDELPAKLTGGLQTGELVISVT